MLLAMLQGCMANKTGGYGIAPFQAVPLEVNIVSALF